MPPAVAPTVATAMPAAVMAATMTAAVMTGTMPAAVMAATMTTTVMATTMTNVMTTKVTAMMTTVPREDMAEAMTVMLNLDYLVLQGDRGGRQRRSETSGKAGNQYDGCGKRG